MVHRSGSALNKLALDTLKTQGLKESRFLSRVIKDAEQRGRSIETMNTQRAKKEQIRSRIQSTPKPVSSSRTIEFGDATVKGADEITSIAQTVTYLNQSATRASQNMPLSAHIHTEKEKTENHERGSLGH